MAVRSEPKADAAAPTKLAIVDSDVHIHTPEGLKSVWGYIPKGWQERFDLKGIQVALSGSTKTMRYAHPTSATIRRDTISPRGGPGGSDPEFVREDYLDRWGISTAILNSLDPGSYGAALGNPDEATVICEAFNRYYIEHWLPVDNRYRYLMVVNPQDPQASAKEIRRAGKTKGIIGVFLPPNNILMGQRWFHPIYEVATELGLPIFVHVTGVDFVYQGAAVSAGGWPETYSERRISFSQIGEANVGSLVFSGVLERFPGLKFCFSEFGFTWALSLIWRMDDTWRTARRDTPWVKKPPSEYVRDRLRFTTQPVDEPANPKHLLQMIDMIGPEHLLFSTDYPHWDNDNPNRVLANLEPAVRDQIYSTNPAKFWNL